MAKKSARPKSSSAKPSPSKSAAAKPGSAKATGSKPSGGKRPTTLARKLTAAPSLSTQGKKASIGARSAGSVATPASKPAKSTKSAAPAAPSGKKQIRSLTKGATKVGPDEAIRERLRLYPKAMTNEIVSMLGFDGIKVTAAQVERARAK